MAGTRRAETRSLVAPGVASQNGPKGNAQRPLLLQNVSSILAWSKLDISRKGINPNFIFLGGDL